MMWQAINTIGLVLLALFAYLNSRETKEIKIAIDGRLTQLLELTAKSARAEGVEQRRTEETKPQ